MQGKRAEFCEEDRPVSGDTSLLKTSIIAVEHSRAISSCTWINKYIYLPLQCVFIIVHCSREGIITFIWWVHHLLSLAYEQALHFGDIVKSTRAKGYSFPQHQSNVFDHWYVIFYPLDIELQRVRTKKNSILSFSFRLHLKSRHIQKTKLPVPITNILYLSVPKLDFQKSPSSDLIWTSRDFIARLADSRPKKLAALAKKLVRSTCSKPIPELENSSYVLLQLLPTLSIVLLDGQQLILRQLRCHVHVSEFFYPVEFSRAKKLTLEGSDWTGSLNLS